MPAPEPSFLEQTDVAPEARVLEAAEAGIAAGGMISHEAMARWLRSWATTNEMPPPACGVKFDTTPISSKLA